MKLTQKTLIELLRLKNDGYSSYSVRKRVGVTERRVNQVWRTYLTTGEVPALGRRVGRPCRPITRAERQVVLRAYRVYRVSASLLEPLVRERFGVRVPHNKIHQILVNEGLVCETRKMVRKKPWVRYERRHSLTAVHMDWYQRADKTWLCPVLDDASRYVLAAIETPRATTDASMLVLERALKHGPIKAVITDHGTQFGPTFDTFLTTHGIKHIRARVKHPQTNGKVERWFQTYQRHRSAFKTLNALLHWYNVVRPHLSLDFSRLETPQQAFKRKMKT